MLKAQAGASWLVFTIQLLFANIVVSCFNLIMLVVYLNVPRINEWLKLLKLEWTKPKTSCNFLWLWEIKDFLKAESLFNEIKNEFPKSDQARDIEQYIYLAKYAQ